MAKPVGGRGNKAPYESTHVRVPIPIKSEVQALIDEFREKYSGQANKPLTALRSQDLENEKDDGLEDDDLEHDDPHRYSDSEIIKTQWKMIQDLRLEIESLNLRLDKANSLTSLDEAKDSARSILRSKKSASQSLAKLLTSIYQVEVTVENLR
ncbi:hypothetical protein [Phormidesmis sp. 146-33]